MAEVFSALDLEDNGARVAVKVFTRGRIQDEILGVAYDRELRALQGLRHPAIVELKNYGTDSVNGNQFLVLEWMDSDLSTVFKTRRYEGWDSFYEEVGRLILDALRFAHERHIAHRDVKPNNILINAAGAPKLADFGLSKIKTWLLPELTLNEFVSRPFSPPEYDDGAYTFSRDVFALCALALQCLSPFPFADYKDLKQSLDSVDLPPAVYDAFVNALSFEPKVRAPNASVLLARLENIQAERSSQWIKKTLLHLEVTESTLSSPIARLPGQEQRGDRCDLGERLECRLRLRDLHRTSTNRNSSTFAVWGQSFPSRCPSPR